MRPEGTRRGIWAGIWGGRWHQAKEDGPATHPPPSSPITIKEYGVAGVYGLITGCMELAFLVGYANIIFAQPALQPHISLIDHMFRMGAMIYGLTYILLDPYKYTIANCQDTAVLFFSGIAGTVLSSMSVDGTADASTIATILACFTLGSLLCGIVLAILAAFPKFVQILNYLPLPVLGGFLAYIGLFIFLGGLNISVSTYSSWGTFGNLFLTRNAHNFYPTLLYGCCLFFVATKFKSQLAVPAVTISAVPIFYIIVGCAGWSEHQLREWDMLLSVGYGTQPQQMWNSLRFSLVDFSVVAVVTGELLKMAFIHALFMLVYLSAVETLCEHEFDLAQELRMLAVGNTLCGVLGGVPGGRVVAFTAFMKKGVPNLRTNAGMICHTSVFVIMWIFDPPVVRYLPRFFVGGIVVYIGIMFIVDWCWETRKRLTKHDYCLLLLTAVVINLVGINWGLIIGIIASLITFAILYSRVPIVERVYTRPSSMVHNIQERESLQALRESIIMFRLSGYLFFGSCSQVIKEVAKEVQLEVDRGVLPKYIFLDCRRVQGMDSSASAEFRKLQRWIINKGLVLVFSEFGKELFDILRREGIIPYKMKEERKKETKMQVCLAFQDTDRGLEWCEYRLLYPTSNISGEDEDEELLSDSSYSPSRRLQLKLEELSDPERAFKCLAPLFDDNTTAEEIGILLNYLEPMYAPPYQIFVDPFESTDELYFLQAGIVHFYVVERYAKHGLNTNPHEGIDTPDERSSTVDRSRFLESPIRSDTFTVQMPSLSKAKSDVIEGYDRKCIRRVATTSDSGFIGEAGFALKEPARYLARSVTPCLLLKLTRRNYMMMENTHPRVALALQRAMIRSLSTTIKDGYLSWLISDIKHDRDKVSMRDRIRQLVFRHFER